MRRPSLAQPPEIRLCVISATAAPWSRTAPRAATGRKAARGTQIKISAVLSNLYGVTCRAMMDA